jgi:transposase
MIECIVTLLDHKILRIGITRVVTEYQAQILVDEQGKRLVVDFPDGVNSSWR